MAYTHQKAWVSFRPGGVGGHMISGVSGNQFVFNAAVTGVKARWSNHFATPFIVRGLHVAAYTSLVSATHLQLFLVSKIGGTLVTTTATLIGNLSLPATTGNPHGVVYLRDNLNKEVKPGQDVVLAGQGAATSTKTQFMAGLYLEPRWDLYGALGSGRPGVRRLAS